MNIDQLKKPFWIQIAGRKNSGKTRLTTSLIKSLSDKGYRVGSLKHSSHKHPVDQPGKDSWLHREAGSEITALVSQNQAGLFFSLENSADPLDQLKPFFAHCHIVVVESGGAIAPLPTFEVWRAVAGQPRLTNPDIDIRAVITGDKVTTDKKLKIIDPDDIAAIVSLLEDMIHEES